MPRSAGSPPRLLLLLVAALLLGAAHGQKAKAPTTKKRSKTGWACGKRSNGELCRDPKACCASWGTCGYTEKYCGMACRSGSCWPQRRWSVFPPGHKSPAPPKRSPSPPGIIVKAPVKSPAPKKSPAPASPKPSPAPKASPPPSPVRSPPPPSPKPSSPPPAPVRSPSPPPPSPKPSPPPPSPVPVSTSVYKLTETNGTYKLRIDEGSMAYAPCTNSSIISAVIRPLFGNSTLKCNSTDTYAIVSRACLGQSGCLLRASADVYGNPCPAGTEQYLEFSFRCSAVTVDNPFAASPPPPTVSALPSPPPKPPVPTMVRYNALWGARGESWNPAGQLSDWSYAGYAANDQEIPDYTTIKTFNVLDFGAVGDGQTDCSVAFQKAIDAASAQNAKGVAVVIPEGRFVLRSQISITKSNVELRGAGMNRTVIYIPTTLSELKGRSSSWAFSGAFISIVGRKVDSSKSANYLASITQDARRGDRRLQVSTTATLKVGQWVRLWMRKPGNQNLRRRLLGAEGTATTSSAAARRQQQLPQRDSAFAQQWLAGRRLAQDNPFALPEEASPASPPPSLEITEAEQPERAASAFAIPLIYEDPYLQAAVEAAAEAETEYAEAAYARGPEPDEADAQSTDPAKAEAMEAAEAALLNPLGLEPIWLASARYGTAAMASEIADGDFPQDLLDEMLAPLNRSSDGSDGRAPSVAVPGSLDFYLYGDNKAVDSGDDFKVFPNSDHIRLASRVAAVGNGWIELERPLPYDVRTKWEPVLHKFAPTVQNSGLRGFTVEFKWTAYPEHFSAVGANAIAIYDAANCWVQDVKMINVDNGVNVGGVDFLTVNHTVFDVTKDRGTGSAKGTHGHHALWASRSADVLFTNFWLAVPWVHDLSLDQFAELTVYSNGGGANVNFDCHRAGTHANLFSNIAVGAGTRVFKSGGAKGRGAHSGANNTWYNIHASNNKPLALPPCSYGPLLTFIGNFGKPKSGRRLASVSDGSPSVPLPTDDRPLLATAIPGGPIIIPEEEPAVALQLAAASPSAAPRPKPAASPKPQRSPENPFALPEEDEEQQQQAGALSAPSPSQQPPSEGSSNSEAAAEAPLPSPPWVEQQQVASEEEDIDTPEEIERADALGAANDCMEFGWTVLRFEHNKALPLHPGDLASAQLEARKFSKRRR